jgi:hypothetical protein
LAAANKKEALIRNLFSNGMLDSLAILQEMSPGVLLALDKGTLDKLGITDAITQQYLLKFIGAKGEPFDTEVRVVVGARYELTDYLASAAAMIATTEPAITPDGEIFRAAFVQAVALGVGAPVQEVSVHGVTVAPNANDSNLSNLVVDFSVSSVTPAEAYRVKKRMAALILNQYDLESSSGTSDNSTIMNQD